MGTQKILLINPSLTRPNEFNTLKRFIPVGLLTAWDISQVT